MVIVRAAIAPCGHAREIRLWAGRHMLAKRRWRGLAEDGREFGFDLEHALGDGDVFHHETGVEYRLSQLPEPVLEIPLASPGESARAGWLIGNLHFAAEIEHGLIRVADDPALRQMLTREGLAFAEAARVFHPLHAAHGHHHP